MVAVAWNKIKAEYLQGVTPKELALKYRLDVNKLYKKIENDNWTSEAREIKGKIGNNIQDKIEKLTNKALKTLENVLDDELADHNVKVQASKALIDISGLKQQRIDGVSNISNIVVTRELVDGNSQV